MDQVIAAFSQFGYPALVSGILLYIIISKLETLAARLAALEKALVDQSHASQEERTEVKETLSTITSLIMDTRAGKR